MIRLLSCSLVAVAAVAFAGCASDPESDAVYTEFCDYAFRATVRSGPDTGTSLAGMLRLAAQDDTTVFGELIVPPATDDGDGLRLPVFADRTGGTLHLKAVLPSGGIVDGSGPMAMGPGSCAVEGDLAGSLMGPGAGDTGDWIALPNPAGQNAYIDNCCRVVHHTPAQAMQFCTAAYGYVAGTPAFDACVVQAQAINVTCSDQGFATAFFSPCMGD